MMSISKGSICAISLLVILCSCSGCPALMLAGFSEKDVSDKTEAWGEYERDGEYVLQMDVFLMDVTGPDADTVLAPPRNEHVHYALFYSAPPSIEDYQQNPNEWPEVRGIVSKGTRIKPVGVIQTDSLMWPSHLDLYGKITGGQFQGEVADIHDLSIAIPEDTYPWSFRPNPKVLEKAQQ